MKNIDKLTLRIAKQGASGILIHSIPGTPHWLICQKIEKEKWNIVLCNPMGTVAFNLGIITEEQHLNLWKELTLLDIKRHIGLAEKAKEYRNTIKNFRKIKNFYENFIKKYKIEQKEKLLLAKYRKKNMESGKN